MGLLSKVRTKESFAEKIASQAKGSQEGFWIAIDNFEKFSMEKYGKVNIIPDMLESTDEEVYDTLQAWINWNSNKAQSTTVIYFSRLKKYFRYFGLKLDPQDIKDELEFKHSVTEELYGMTLEDIQKIFSDFDYDTRVQYMCQLSSLMRIGEIVQIRRKHLQLDKENIIVRIPAHIAKFNKGRTTFFSKEASSLLRPKLRNLKDDDLVFAKNENHRYAEINSEQKLRRCTLRVGLDMRYESTNRFFINTHSFRAYGITKLSRFDPNFAKKIAGQKGYLLQYDRMSDEDKLERYQELEGELTIDNTKKLKRVIEKQKKEVSEVEKLKMELSELRSYFKKYTEEEVNKTKDIEFYKHTRPELFK